MSETLTGITQLKIGDVCLLASEIYWILLCTVKPISPLNSTCAFQNFWTKIVECTLNLWKTRIVNDWKENWHLLSSVIMVLSVLGPLTQLPTSLASDWLKLIGYKIEQLKYYTIAVFFFPMNKILAIIFLSYLHYSIITNFVMCIPGYKFHSYIIFCSIVQRISLCRHQLVSSNTHPE